MHSAVEEWLLYLLPPVDGLQRLPLVTSSRMLRRKIPVTRDSLGRFRGQTQHGWTQQLFDVCVRLPSLSCPLQRVANWRPHVPRPRWVTGGMARCPSSPYFQSTWSLEGMWDAASPSTPHPPSPPPEFMNLQEFMYASFPCHVLVKVKTLLVYLSW